MRQTFENDQKIQGKGYLIMEVSKHKYSNNMTTCNFIKNISKESYKVFLMC